MPHPTLHRGAKEGMPVRGEGRGGVGSPDELNQGLQRTCGEAAGVQVPPRGPDLLNDRRASVALHSFSTAFSAWKRVSGGAMGAI